MNMFIKKNGKMRSQRLWLLAICLLLVACPYSTKIDFATNPNILRGEWLGAPEDDMAPTSRLILSANYVDETKYDVTGTIQFTNEALLSISGTVYAFGSVIYIQPQTSVFNFDKETFVASVIDSNGQIVRQVCMASSQFSDNSVTYRGFIYDSDFFNIAEPRIDCPGPKSSEQFFTLRK